MRNECDKVLDYFNDQLSENEKAQFEQHLESCSECREELEELRELTADLPFSSEPVDPPEGMKDRVLGAVFEEDEPVSNEEDPVVYMDEHREQKQEQVPKQSKRPWVVRGLAAALILSLVGNLYALTNNGQEQVSDPEPEPPQIEESTDQVAKRVQLKGENTQANATAAMIRQNEKELLTIQAEQLTPLQGEEVYQVWLIQGETPYRAGTFVANENGEGAVAFSMDQLPEDVEWDAVAVSKEPDANSETPQGEVVMSSSL
ncbi:anti-sigma factor [Halobacillus yeomjeoni]|uniref:anti-sigma factor n=1 Tax=Halobacillus yeomjeoni TaxID=311194 RepID=UPI001CD21FF5|nr:anti-sigma factor [Halobacillus yeomjeoni]MCA0984713.1 anti-sigma factor [Halobacillus yeomjeoni]